MENGVYRLRDTLPQILLGSVVGAVPGTLAGAAIPAVLGFALLGLLTPHRVTAYFATYIFVVLIGGLLGAVVGGSTGACRLLEHGCPKIAARQVRVAAIVGAALAVPFAYAIWLVARQLARLFF